MSDSIYAPLVRDMTWSYSRVKTYENCPYKFYLRYILGRKPSRAFFAEYGSFVHSLLERYYKGEIRRQDLPAEYLIGFSDAVTSKAMSGKVFNSYFNDGLRYFREFVPVEGGIVKTEGKVDGEIDGIRFTGVVDLTVDDGENLMIVDHKSRALKPRSKRAKPTKSDEELDEMLIQLYLYVPLIEKTYWRVPKTLAFNCFRTGTLIKEPFDNGKFESAKAWLKNGVEKIATDSDFDPEPEYFKCHNLCEMCEHCEYIKYV